MGFEESDSVDNTKAQTTAFITFSPFKARWRRHLSALVMLGARTQTAAARKPAFLHTARFSRVSRRQLARAGLSGDNLRNGALLFLSSFNGDSDAYFRGFSEPLAPVMNDVWRHCVDWQGAQPFVNLIAFINAYRRRSQSYFNAYPVGSKRIRASLVLRRQLDKIHALAHSADHSEQGDREFAEAFEHASQLLWGNAEPTLEDL
jgi:hypothetical protein